MRSRGAVELAQLSQTAAVIADKCGVSRQAVTEWLAGSKKPSKKSQALLRKVYGIEPAWWTAKPAKQPPIVDAKILSHGELIDGVRAEASKMLARLQHLDDRSVVEKGRMLQQLATTIARMGSGNERRFLKSDEWIAMRGRIVEVLKKFPDALEAMLQTLEEAEGE